MTREFDHSTRTTKHYSPLGGECICEHCLNLPWYEGQPVPWHPLKRDKKPEAGNANDKT